MKKIRSLKGWGIYQNTEKEIKEYGFSITVLHPDNMECVKDSGMIFNPSDSDMELDTVEAAEDWIKNY
jgi:predicted nucleotide-binding protein